MSDFRSVNNLLADHVHKWEQCNHGRHLRCVFCRALIQIYDEPICPSGAELHHRSCLMRKGATRCTCEV